MDVLSQPLSPSELDELDDFLASPQLESTSMDIPMLEGFLTALVIGPRRVSPSEWLPRVWDRHDGTVEPVFVDSRHADRIVTLLMRFMNGLADRFLNEADAFQPIFCRQEWPGAPEWCEGFLFATDFCDDEWADLWDEHPELAAPFRCLGTDGGRAALHGEADVELWTRLVPQVVVAIHEIWLDARVFPPSEPDDDDAAAAGDLSFSRLPPDPADACDGVCPCGSGERFRDCGGAAGRSVH